MSQCTHSAIGTEVSQFFPLLSLSPEILVHIVEYLDPKDIVALSACSKALFRTLEQDIFWEKAVDVWRSEQVADPLLQNRSTRLTKDIFGLGTLSATYRALKKLPMTFWPAGIWAMCMEILEYDPLGVRGILCKIRFVPCLDKRPAMFNVKFLEVDNCVSKDGFVCEYSQLDSDFTITLHVFESEKPHQLVPDMVQKPHSSRSYLYQEKVLWLQDTSNGVVMDTKNTTNRLSYSINASTLAFERVYPLNHWKSFESLMAQRFMNHKSKFPLPIQYSALYGGHGVEIIKLNYVENYELGKILMIGQKNIGDRNVPATQATFEGVVYPHSFHVGPYKSNGDYRPVVRFTERSSEEIDMTERPVRIMIDEAHGIINRVPYVWMPEEVPVTLIIYSMFDKDWASTKSPVPTFSVIWKDEGSSFRHMIDFFETKPITTDECRIETSSCF